jgi:phosphoglycolate phosphatase
MAAALVVLDLDGTLVDTAPDLVATLNVVLGRRGLPPVAYEAARNMVGGGARAMIERGLAAEHRNLPAAEIDQLVAAFIDTYATHIADRSRPFPGMAAALDELKAAGCNLAVCTNKLEWLAVKLLDTLRLSSRFVAICGPDTFGVRKPDPELLRRTIARAQGTLAKSVMVGDTVNDIAMARGAGVPAIAVDYGYSQIPVAELAANRVIRVALDLPRAVFDLLDAAEAAPAG